jgi:hypothetical protein
MHVTLYILPSRLCHDDSFQVGNGRFFSCRCNVKQFQWQWLCWTKYNKMSLSFFCFINHCSFLYLTQLNVYVLTLSVCTCSNFWTVQLFSILSSDIDIWDQKTDHVRRWPLRDLFVTYKSRSNVTKGQLWVYDAIICFLGRKARKSTSFWPPTFPWPRNRGQRSLKVNWIELNLLNQTCSWLQKAFYVWLRI